MGLEVCEASVALWAEPGAVGWPALPVDVPAEMFAAEAVSDPLPLLPPDPDDELLFATMMLAPLLKGLRQARIGKSRRVSDPPCGVWRCFSSGS
jgi:hypothetical protein